MARDRFDVSKLQRRWGTRAAGKATDRQSPKNAARAARVDVQEGATRRSAMTGAGAGRASAGQNSEQFRVRRNQAPDEEATSQRALSVSTLAASWENFSTVSADRFSAVEIANAPQLALALLDQLERDCTGPAMRRRLGRGDRNEAVAGLLALIDEAVKEQLSRWANRVVAPPEALPDEGAEPELDEAEASPSSVGEGAPEAAPATEQPATPAAEQAAGDDGAAEAEEEDDEEAEDEDEDDFALDPPAQFNEALADLEGLLEMYLFELRGA